jgi:CRP-like cAMP-binding protein
VSPKQVAPAVNRLLATLPRADRVRVLADCTTVHLAFAEVLYTPGQRLRHVYFPTTGFISMVLPVDATAALEVGLVGDEGMYGIPLLLGVDESSARAVIQGAGLALRMDAAAFSRALDHSPSLQKKLHRYTNVCINQLAQTAACTRFHVVEARLARWLLMTQDRAHSDSFSITQEFLAYMLGVRRVGITKAAGALQKDGLIRYSRGRITVLDRRRLRAAACGCYRADIETYARMSR